MALVDVEELKTVLGVGDLYGDDPLEQVAEAAEATVLSVLTRFEGAVERLCCEVKPYVKMRLTVAKPFYVGQAVTLSGLPAHFDGAATVHEIVDERTLVVSKSPSHQLPIIEDPIPIIPAGRISASAGYYDDVPAVREAALAVAVDLWQSRLAPGGQLQGVDFAPSPYRLGRSLLSRVQGLLGPWMDPRSLVG